MQMRKGIRILLVMLIFSLSGCGSTILAGENAPDTGTEQELETTATDDQTGPDERTEDTTTETTELSSEELLQELDSYFERIDAEQLPEIGRAHV